MSAMNTKATWCVVVAEGVSTVEPQTHLHCRRCGKREVPGLPADLMAFVAQLKRFTRDHAQCREVDTPEHIREANSR
jgi:hypothetical protein